MAQATHKQERRFARSKVPQANYQTATTVTDPTKIVELLVQDSNLAKVEVREEDNKGESHGHFQATESYVTECDTSRQFEMAISAEEIGRDLLLAFGADTVSQPDAGGAPTVRQHKFTPQNLGESKQGPAITLVEIVGAAINRLFPSMVAEGFSLKGEGVKRVMESLSLRGSGKVTTPSGIDAEDVVELAGLHCFTNSQVKLTIADTGTLDNDQVYGAANRLDNWGFELKNNLLLGEGYVPGAALYQTANDPDSGALRSECLIESQEFMLNLTARLASQSQELAALRSRKKLDIEILLIGGQIDATAFNYQLRIHAPLVKYEAVELGEQNKIVTVQLKPKLFFDAASEYAASIELINKVVSYTA